MQQISRIKYFGTSVPLLFFFKQKYLTIIFLILNLISNGQDSLKTSCEIRFENKKLSKLDYYHLTQTDSIIVYFEGNYSSANTKVKIKIDSQEFDTSFWDGNVFTDVIGKLKIPLQLAEKKIEIIFDSSDIIIIPYKIGYKYIHIRKERTKEYVITITNKWWLYK